MFLQTFAETGVFGAVALIVIIIGAAMFCIRSSQKLEYPLYVKAFALALLMMVIGCMTENAFANLQIQVIFWMLVGLCMVFASLTAKEQNLNGNAFIKTLIVILVLAAWGLIMYKPVLKQYKDNILLNEIF